MADTRVRNDVSDLESNFDGKFSLSLMKERKNKVSMCDLVFVLCVWYSGIDTGKVRVESGCVRIVYISFCLA